MALNNSIDDLDPELAAVYAEAKATWKQDYPAGPWPELNETARSKAVQDAYYARTRKPISEVQRLYKAAGLYAIGADEASKWATNAAYGQSAHNAGPGEYAAAFDILMRVLVGHQHTPGGVTYEPRYFTAFGGYMLAAASKLLAAGEITDKIVWGNDWNSNGRRDDGSYDPPHFERKNWRKGLRKKPIPQHA